MSKQLHEAFIGRIQGQFADADKFLSAIEQTPYYSVRQNVAKRTDMGLPIGKPVPWCPDAYYLCERPNYTLNPLFHAGAFYPQEASSMYLWHVLSSVSEHLPQDPIVLDLCAAPGGKTTLLASYFGGRGVLVANEVVRNRAWILRENIAKWGCPNALVTNAEPARFGAEGAMFDLLVIDAPCSGEGMFRKDDVAVAEWTPENAAMCAARQRTIIADVWDAVVEGGVVIYSTCTFNPEENERNMQWIDSEYDVEFLRIPVVPQSCVTVVPFAQGEGYGFYPHKVEGEGFFICAMRKLSGRYRKPAKDKQKTTKATVPINCLKEQSSYDFYNIENKIVALPRQQSALMLRIANSYKSMLCGIETGEFIRKDFIPSAMLPLSAAFAADSYPTAELTADEALHYLRGEWTATQPLAQGWNVVGFNGCRLGFAKAVGNRVNNYYPKEWRIKMKI
ncbi:MAG: hypothetical protein J6Y82_04330 [Bacteroidales bacterium]|nr:hypothetical protein [Bacteroidales bacterium]